MNSQQFLGYTSVFEAGKQGEHRNVTFLILQQMCTIKQSDNVSICLYLFILEY